MKEIVLDRLNKMQDLEQRKLLKQIMTGLFLHLTEHQEAANEQLERRVFGELETQEHWYDIHTALCVRDELDPVHDYLYPMRPADAAEHAMELEELRARLEEAYAADRESAVAWGGGGSTLAGLAAGQAPSANAHGRDAVPAANALGAAGGIVLQTLYMECGQRQLRTLAEQTGGRIFQGRLETTEGPAAFTFRLRPCTAYLEEIERLYRLFQANAAPWRTVNMPFARKFFDVVLVECEPLPGPEARLVRIATDLQEYDRFKRPELIPLWNVEKLELKSIGFPIAAADKVNYEHVISLRKTGDAHGYLVNAEEEIRYTKREPGEMTVVAPREKAGVWSIWKLTQPASAGTTADTALTEWQTKRVYTNKRRDAFTSRFADKQAAIIRSKAEIARIVHSYEASAGFQLERVELDPTGAGSAAWLREPATYAMNPFMVDTLRPEHRRPVLKLSFSGGEEGLFRDDVLSFLVSEVQRVLPEYHCIGECL
ncbi:normocyte-binding protein [Paenibacillus turpanensis]|uniref:normocyte-binding protein n=1 Tax=Paenibacillus turpanensis TaxID=2689078 RepID=UPI0014078681|nr:normocyte-binding protein [Paenibacillus turpanensis]